jgi:hypothetical protein
MKRPPQPFAAVPLEDGTWHIITKADLPPTILPFPKEVRRPPWNASNEQMRAWVLAQLEAMDAAVMTEEAISKPLDQRYHPPKYLRMLAEPKLADLGSEERAIAEAKCGNMEPLRKLYPQLAEFLARPKLKRGEHFEPFNPQWDAKARIRAARADANRIKALWKAAYNGRCNRDSELGQITAVEIAADRWGISVNAILK